jgi:hypothetical protein
MSVDGLAWPSSAAASDLTTGWVLGWRTSPVSSWSLEAAVVAAGVLPTTSVLKSDIGGEYKSLCRRIRRIKEECCYCCSCASVGTNAPSGCAGCTRRLCFEEIEVIAFLTDKETILSRDISLPVIRLSTEGLPRLNCEAGKLPEPVWRQLLVYEDCISESKDTGPPGDNMKFCLFQAEGSPQQSYFSRDLIARFTHVQSVMDVIVKHGDSSKHHVDPIESKLEPCVVVDENETKTAKSDTCDPVEAKSSGWISHSLVLLIARSFFLRHLASPECVPLVSLFKAMTETSSNRQTGRARCRDYRKLHGMEESHYEQVARYTTTFNQRVGACVDWGTGLLLGLAIVSLVYSGVTTRSLGLLGESHYRLLYQALDWLKRFPIGFKLDVRLTQNMGNNIRWLSAGTNSGIHGRFLRDRRFHRHLLHFVRSLQFESNFVS